MSLVNDALKRAKDAHDRQAAPPLRSAPLHTLPSAPASAGSRRFWIVLPILAAIAIAGGIGCWLEFSNRPTSVTTQAEPAQQNPIFVKPTKTPLPPPAPNITETKTELTSPPPPTPAPEVIPPPVVAAGKPAPVAPPQLPQPPPNPTGALKLQGILYSATKPAAILNGRTVYVGDSIGGMTISKIAPDRVTVLHHNQPYVIRLP